MKTVIIDTLTYEYYCVPMTEFNDDGEPTAGPNDFPFWSSNEDDAFDFGHSSFDAKLLANNEMKFNDLTCDGTRNPEIIEID